MALPFPFTPPSPSPGALRLAAPAVDARELHPGRLGLKQHCAASFRSAVAEIKISGVRRESFVEAAQVLEIRARHQHERA